jgi:hypothetical protein
VDFDLWLRLSRHHLFTCTHEVTSRWRWHDAQQSKQRENQLAAVYRFRRSYYEHERAVGRPAIAAEMERRMADIWNEDMNGAWEKRDTAHLRFLWELAELVPGIPADCRYGWAQRVQERQALEHCDDERICKESGLFDAEWYRQRYADVADAVDDPLRHYFRVGWLEARDPHPLFDTDWYVSQNPEIDASGVNPLAHYIRAGAAAGRDPNPLFDSDWYLERNPDVSAAGMNPLSHYVRWGAAKGLDPSEGFQTVWYLERHPDVATTGMNPLAHYLHWGSVELREPVSPVPFIFKKLAIKPKSCSMLLEHLLLIYSSPPEVTPTRARRDNNSQVGVSWAEQCLFDCSRRFACGDLEGALRFAKHAVQILPDEDDPITLFAGLFHRWNRSALETFTLRFAGADCLVVHISHREGIPRAEESCKSFHDDSGRIANVIVVADEAASEHSYSFDDARSILFVPANDRYEGLPGKVAKAFVFLGLCPLHMAILKVDDDSVCVDVFRLKHFVEEVMSRHMHGGRINTRLYPFGSSHWHFGKCSDQNINTRPDGFLNTAAYVGGEGYWLNAAAVTAMAKIALIHERYFESEYYEDRAVGSALFHYGVKAHPFDLFAADILHDAGLPSGSRENPPVRLRGSRVADNN